MLIVLKVTPWYTNNDIVEVMKFLIHNILWFLEGSFSNKSFVFS